jgi:hypothetical protein
MVEGYWNDVEREIRKAMKMWRDRLGTSKGGLRYLVPIEDGLLDEKCVLEIAKDVVTGETWCAYVLEGEFEGGESRAPDVDRLLLGWRGCGSRMWIGLMLAVARRLAEEQVR